MRARRLGFQLYPLSLVINCFSVAAIVAAADSTELFLASMILYSFPCMVAWVNGQGK